MEKIIVALNLANIYLFKVNKGITKKGIKCSQLTMKTRLQ